MSQTSPVAEVAVPETAIAAVLTGREPSLELKMHRGARTPLRFSGIEAELEAVRKGTAVFDLGFRAGLRATGKDRVRWLNGMITQTVKGLAAGQTGYTLVLNPQGRIQGDGDLLVHEEELLLETDRSQVERLLSHLKRYIIMDVVQLEALEGVTVVGLAGPKAAETLARVGAEAPEAGSFRAAQVAGVPVTLVGAFGPVVPRFEIHVAAERAAEVWQALVVAGVVPCGIAAMEDFRVLEGVPQFDRDFSDKNLPQETGLMRALNFTKGCYIGQEIVERIRARATVHRSLRQFELQGDVPRAAVGEKIELRAGDAVVGELTSVARFELPDLKKTMALGMARVEALEKNEPLRYAGGTAIPLVAANSSLES